MSESPASRARVRVHLRRTAAGVALLAALCLGVAQVPLEGALRIESLGEDLAEATGARVRFGGARLDPLGAGGIVLEEVALAGPGWQLSLARSVWRPRLAALVGDGPPTSLRARSFELVLEPDTLDTRAVLALLEAESLPALGLRGGRVRLADGTPLLEDVALDLASGLRLELRGRQRGGGRLDLRGRRAPDGAIELDLFPEALSVGSLERRLPAALPRRWLPTLDGALGGHWSARFEPGRRQVHRFGLELRTPSAESLEAAGRHAPPRLRLQARGRLALVAGPGGSSPAPWEFESGSHLVVNGAVRQLSAGGEAPAAAGLSGPVVASFSLLGPTDRPSVDGALFIDEAQLRLGQALHKPAGLRGRARIHSRMEASQRTTRVDLELGALRAALVRRGSEVLEGATDWVPLRDVARWLPAAEDRADGGRVRLTRILLEGTDRFEGDVEFEGASFTGRRSPLPLSALTGRGHITPEGFTARGVAAVVAGVPVRLDLSALPGAGGGAARVRFAVRAEEVDLPGLGPAASSREAEPGSGSLPAALLAAAEAPVALLRRRRESLAQVEVEAGRFEVARLHAGGELLRDVELDVALRALRLDVSRLAFRHQDRRAHYSGWIDLDRLVPVAEFASTP